MLTLRAFFQRRTQFKEFISSITSLNVNRYFRLMAVACVTVVCTIPLASYGVYLNVSSGIHPWLGWEDTHSNYSRVILVPALIWRMSHQSVIALELTRYSTIFCAFVFFALFGFSVDARERYRVAFWMVAVRLGVSPTTDSETQSIRLVSYFCDVVATY